MEIQRESPGESVGKSIGKSSEKHEKFFFRMELAFFKSPSLPLLICPIGRSAACAVWWSLFWGDAAFWSFLCNDRGPPVWQVAGSRHGQARQDPLWLLWFPGHASGLYINAGSGAKSSETRDWGAPSWGKPSFTLWLPPCFILHHFLSLILRNLSRTCTEAAVRFPFNWM